MFEDIRWIIENIIGTGEGFVIRENLSPENIETCNGVAMQDENTKTCALCVALNDTVFRNNNKPTYYHRHCKCKNKKYELKEVKLDFPMSKINKYLFKNEEKRKLMESMGYTIEDSDYVYRVMADNAKDKFLKGDYTLSTLNCNGQKVI